MRISDWSSDVCSSDLITPRMIQARQRKLAMDSLVVGHVERHDDPFMHDGGCRNDQVASELQLGRPRLRPQKVAESRGGEHACLQAHHIHAWDNDIVSVGFQEPLQPALVRIGVAALSLESESFDSPLDPEYRDHRNPGTY